VPCIYLKACYWQCLYHYHNLSDCTQAFVSYTHKYNQLVNGQSELVNLYQITCYNISCKFLCYLIDELLLYKKRWQSYEAINKMYTTKTLYIKLISFGLIREFIFLMLLFNISVQKLVHKDKIVVVLSLYGKNNEVRVICLQPLKCYCHSYMAAVLKGLLVLYIYYCYYISSNLHPTLSWLSSQCTLRKRSMIPPVVEGPTMNSSDLIWPLFVASDSTWYLYLWTSGLWSFNKLKGILTE